MGTKEEGEAAGRAADAYQDTVRRIEPVAMMDADYTLASIAVSMKRIADTLDALLTMAKDDIAKGG